MLTLIYADVHPMVMPCLQQKIDAATGTPSTADAAATAPGSDPAAPTLQPSVSAAAGDETAKTSIPAPPKSSTNAYMAMYRRTDAATTAGPGTVADACGGETAAAASGAFIFPSEAEIPSHVAEIVRAENVAFLKDKAAHIKEQNTCRIKVHCTAPHSSAAPTATASGGIVASGVAQRSNPSTVKIDWDAPVSELLTAALKAHGFNADAATTSGDGRGVTNTSEAVGAAVAPVAKDGSAGGGEGEGERVGASEEAAPSQQEKVSVAVALEDARIRSYNIQRGVMTTPLDSAATLKGAGVARTQTLMLEVRAPGGAFLPWADGDLALNIVALVEEDGEESGGDAFFAPQVQVNVAADATLADLRIAVCSLLGSEACQLLLLMSDSARFLEDDARRLGDCEAGGLGLTEGCTVHAESSSGGTRAADRGGEKQSSKVLALHERALSTAVLKFNSPSSNSAASTNEITVDLRISLGTFKELLCKTAVMVAAGLDDESKFKVKETLSAEEWKNVDKSLQACGGCPPPVYTVVCACVRVHACARAVVAWVGACACVSVRACVRAVGSLGAVIFEVAASLEAAFQLC